MRTDRSAVLFGALALVVASWSFPGTAAAQRDDRQWEVRTAPYDGGPVRPGAELDGRLNPLSWIGGLGFVAGYALIIYPATARPEALIPFAGPWLAISDEVTWNGFGDLDVALCVIGGILQPAGVVLGILGLLDPHLTLVFTAPVGEPSPNETYLSGMFVPGAPGADVGASIVGSWL